MNAFMRQYLNFKLNNLQLYELMNFAAKHQIPLSRGQAIKVLRILRSERIDIGNEIQRRRISKQIFKEVGREIHLFVQRLFNQYS